MRKREKRLAELLIEERRLWAQGIVTIAGMDEVGAGPIAGPVVAACVVLDPERLERFLGVDDSKRVPPGERASLAERIRTDARCWAVASATVEEIDRINILQAALLAMRRALDDVRVRIGRVDHLLIDARSLDSGIPETALVKGDARSLSIAAASIVAKVERDAWMTRAATQYPSYGFERHKGYATEDHLAAVRRHGVTPLHRRTFEPISTLLHQLSLFD